MKFKKGVIFMSGNDIVWDLTEIFASVDDPKIYKKSFGVEI